MNMENKEERPSLPKYQMVCFGIDIDIQGRMGKLSPF